MTSLRPTGYRNYTADGTYWTVRKSGDTFWVLRIDPSGGEYTTVEVWGGYHRAGAAGGAAAQLAYGQAMHDAGERFRSLLHDSLEDAGLGVPAPSKPAVPPSQAPKTVHSDEELSDDDLTGETPS